MLADSTRSSSQAQLELIVQSLQGTTDSDYSCVVYPKQACLSSAIMTAVMPVAAAAAVVSITAVVVVVFMMMMLLMMNCLPLLLLLLHALLHTIVGDLTPVTQRAASLLPPSIGK
jgi:hypothetical protein